MGDAASPPTLSSALRQETREEEHAPPAPAPTLPANFAKPRVFKIIVLGESGVGKTCLSFRFCAGKFPLVTEATIGLDFREKVVELDGERLRLQLWDTAGQERFKRSITHHYYRNVSAVVFVYDVTSAASLVALDSWLEEVRLHGVPEAAPRVLVGNKCDQVRQKYFENKSYFKQILGRPGGDDEHGTAVGGRAGDAALRDLCEGRLAGGPRGRDLPDGGPQAARGEGDGPRLPRLQARQAGLHLQPRRPA